MALSGRRRSSTIQVPWTYEAPRQGKNISTTSEMFWAKWRCMAVFVGRLKLARNRLFPVDQNGVENMTSREAAPRSDVNCLRISPGKQETVSMPHGLHCGSDNKYSVRIYPGVSSGFDTVIQAPNGTIKGSHQLTLEAALQAVCEVGGMPIGEPVHIYARSLPELIARGVTPRVDTMRGGST